MITILSINPHYTIDKERRITAYTVEFRYDNKKASTGESLHLEGTMKFDSESPIIDLGVIASNISKHFNLN